ncbi:MAG: hypothetical protein QOH57_1937 [Mycobacterium sp.]|jgi:hypothetical protein|nr:hypothetical protein [Mycobacterium sp.]
MRTTLPTVVSRLTTPLWKPTVAGIFVGAVIGGLVLNAASTSEASALIRIYPPTDIAQTMTGSSPSPDPQQSYISGEIAYLNSPAFGQAVAKELNETDPPQLSATQDTQSTIVTFSASDANSADATRIVDAGLKVYESHAQQLIRERGQSAIDAINAILTKAAAPDPAPPGPGDQSARIDRQTPTDQLQAQLYWIEVQTQRLAPFQVISPPAETPTEGVPKWQLGVIGGGLLGGLVFLAVALAWRRRVGVVTSPSALEGSADRVLSPTVPLAQLAPATAEYKTLARTLTNQIPVADSGTILVVGASSESGTSDVARLIATGVEERSGVRVISLLDSPESVEQLRSGPTAPGSTTVIDGGSIDTAAALPGAADAAAQVVVVAAIGRDVSADVRMATSLAHDRNLPVTAVCTKGASRRGHNIKRQNPLQGKRSRPAAGTGEGALKRGAGPRDASSETTKRLDTPSQ